MRNIEMAASDVDRMADIIGASLRHVYACDAYVRMYAVGLI